MEQKMFCNQCQEAAGCIGCTQVGVCGKQPGTAAWQDLLVYVTKGLGAVVQELRLENLPPEPEVAEQIYRNLFITITNSNFDDAAILESIQETLSLKQYLLQQVKSSGGLPAAAFWNAPREEYAAKAAQVSVTVGANADVVSLRQLITYGLKGIAA